MAPFPHPAHRTGQADFPHPALGQDFTLSRATPSAASEQFSELIGFPISRSFTTYCVCLELRSLPSTGVTRLPRYYEPLRHPRAPSLSLTGFRLVPWLASVKAPVGPRRKEARRGKPVGDQLRHAFPCEPIFLTAPPKRSSPEIGHIMPERRERPTFCRNRVVGEVASHDLPQPFPLLWNRLMHPAQ